jgi:hypothetical protein
VTTAENSSAAISCAVAMVMVIASNAVPAAITQVDARTGCKFTASAAFLIDINNSRLAPPPKPCIRSRGQGGFGLV